MPVPRTAEYGLTPHKGPGTLVGLMRKENTASAALLGLLLI